MPVLLKPVAATSTGNFCNVALRFDFFFSCLYNRMFNSES
jgi:hypothetical protein